MRMIGIKYMNLLLRQLKNQNSIGYNSKFYTGYYQQIITYISLNLLTLLNALFCKQDSETISHLFVECLYVKELWSDIED